MQKNWQKVGRIAKEVVIWIKKTVNPLSYTLNIPGLLPGSLTFIWNSDITELSLVVSLNLVMKIYRKKSYYIRFTNRFTFWKYHLISHKCMEQAGISSKLLKILPSELAMCLCEQEIQWNPGLYQEYVAAIGLEGEG